MCKTSVMLIIGLLLGCSGGGNPVVPATPGNISGDYVGIVSYYGYPGDYYPASDSTEIFFTISEDSAYYFTIPILFRSCSRGWGYYNYEAGRLELHSKTIVQHDCTIAPFGLLIGNFEVVGNRKVLTIYQSKQENLLNFKMKIELTSIS